MQTERRSTLHEENMIYLRSWAGATEREIQDVIDKIAPLERRAERLRERLDLITRLADLVESELTTNEPVASIDLTEEGGENETASPPETVAEGLREIFELPS